MLVVLALALAWVAMPAQQEPGNPAAKRETVEDLVQVYFRSWSAKDLGTYRECFDKSARIWCVDRLGGHRFVDLPEFIGLQKQAHQQSKEGLVELPVRSTVTTYGSLAQVRIYWRLEEGKTESFGNDLWTLVRGDGQWRILSLVYNLDESGGAM